MERAARRAEQETPDIAPRPDGRRGPLLDGRASIKLPP